MYSTRDHNLGGIHSIGYLCATKSKNQERAKDAPGGSFLGSALWCESIDNIGVYTHHRYVTFGGQINSFSGPLQHSYAFTHGYGDFYPSYVVSIRCVYQNETMT
jgi:hypothetical protein